MSQKFLRSDKDLIVNYVTAREAGCALCISIRSLQRLRRQGVLRIGECWVRKFPNNSNSDVLYDLEACRRALSAATIAAQIEQDRLGLPKVELA
jgi:hypothetical protein